MIPLRVTAIIPGPVAMPNGPLALDGLLAWAVAARKGLPPAMFEEEIVPIEIPVQREMGGRFHLASYSLGTFEQHDRHWINRRFPIPEAQSMGEPRFKRILISGGPCKSYRLPLEVGYLVDARLDWYCVGESEGIRELLALVSHVGKRRGVGKGEVQEWQVEPCESWDDGFPVVREGQALRSLPLDWPGLAEGVEQGYRTLTYPYWLHGKEQLCAVPAWSL